MCKAEELTEELMGVYKRMQSTLQSYTDKLSNIDKQEQDILHFIENDRFNACEGYLYAKKLQELRHERRKIKNEWEPLNKMGYWLMINKNVEHSKKVREKITNLSISLSTNIYKKSYTPKILKDYSIKNELKSK